MILKKKVSQSASQHLDMVHLRGLLTWVTHFGHANSRRPHRRVTTADGIGTGLFDLFAMQNPSGGLAVSWLWQATGWNSFLIPHSFLFGSASLTGKFRHSFWCSLFFNPWSCLALTLCVLSYLEWMRRVQQHTYTSGRKWKDCFPLFDRGFLVMTELKHLWNDGPPSSSQELHSGLSKASPSRHTIIYKAMGVREKRKHRTQQDLQVWGRRQNFELTDISVFELLLWSRITTVQLVPVHSEVLRPAVLSSYHVGWMFFFFFFLTAVSYVCFPVMDLSSLLASLLFVLQLPGIFAGLREGEQSDTCWTHCELIQKKKEKSRQLTSWAS